MELSLKDYVEKIEYFVKNGGPEESEWEVFNELLNGIYEDFLNNTHENERVKQIYKAFGDAISLETLQGHVLNRPLGYLGDYFIIDSYYEFKPKSKERYIKFDKFGLDMKGGHALRNRKEFLINLMTTLHNNSKDSISILNIASGPCRDIKEFYDGKKDAKVQFDCVEFDPKAIDYAKTVLDGYSKNVNFINKNALRFTTDKKYDLVWSGGLFDYFDDNIFVRLLKRYSTFLKENAELVIGNFSPNNPSKAYMELMNWKLNYRDENHLLQLAEQAGLNMNNVFVDSEPLGINLFLHYRNEDRKIS
jgi:SAM-dependent methyltransferase